MSKQMTAVAILALVAGTAMAAPRESRSYATPVNSNPPATAETFTLNFTGSDGGGAYMATRVLITGTLTPVNAATYAAEAVMDVTPPGGAAFTVQLSNLNDVFVSEAINANSPIGSAVAPAGDWTFQLYETFDDGGDGATDASLADIVVTLDDSAITPGETPGTAIELGALVDGTTVTQNVVVPPAGFKWFKFTALESTSTSGRAITLTTGNSTSGEDSEIAVLSEAGDFGWLNDNDATVGAPYSTLKLGRLSPIGAEVPAGNYFVAVGTFDSQFFLDFITTSTGPGGTFQLDILQEFLGVPVAPESEDLGTLVDGTNVSRTYTLAAGEVKWYKATVAEAAVGNDRKLSISTRNTLSGMDTEIGVYDTAGTLVATNDDNPFPLSYLHFGAGGGALEDIAAGLYYIPVSSFNATFTGAWSVASTGPGGEFQLDVLQEVLGAPVAPDAEDLGTLVDGTNVTRTITLNAGEIKWYKATVGDCTAAAGRTLSISTLNTVPATDTEVGLYTVAGALVASNDDNPFPRSLLTFGADGTGGDVAAGLYYIPLSTYNVNFFATGWEVTSTGLGGEAQLDVLQSLASAITVWDEATNGAGDAGNTPETAQVVAGSGTLNRITGTFEGVDFDAYQINICDFASFSATSQNSPGAPDTQMFLFDSAGMPVAFNDDTFGLSAALDASLVTADGTYLLCISRYDNDAVDAGGNEIWLDAPFAGVRGPDGPGAAGPLAGSNGANAGAGSYRIDLTGACYAGPSGPCSIADVGMSGGEPGQDNLLDNNDFIAFINFFFAQDPIADMGMAAGEPGSDSLFDNNDFIAFINHFFEDSAACNG